MPIAGVVSDGQPSICKAVAIAFPEVAHGLCHFHYLKETAKQIYDADRSAKKEMKKLVRGVRTLDRQHQTDETTNEVVLKYCQAVHAALTDDSRVVLNK